MPLGGLYKSQVRELAQDLSIPEEIISKPPSAGLWNNQTDEEELGITYEELDQILARMAQGARLDDLPKEKVALVNALKARSAHKLTLPRIFKPRL
jgi:NAD+ synthase